jgi:hypothetical protein
LYRYCATQLLVEKVFAVAESIQFRADGVDDVLGGLGMV